MTATPGKWHAAALLERYERDELDPTTAASVEAHLLGCAPCRGAVSALPVTAARVDAVWGDVIDRVDEPRRGPLERALIRLGLGEGDARLLAATPSLQVSWLGAVMLVLGFAVAAARGVDDAASLFLLVAPLLPVSGVAAAYGPGVDPAFDVSVAAPYRATRLLLLRSVSVLATSAALSSLAALALPATGWAQAGWLLPALGLTAATLAISTRTTPTAAATGVALTWAAVVVTLVRLDRAADVAGTLSQLAFVLVTVVAATVLTIHRDRFDTRSSG